MSQQNVEIVRRLYALITRGDDRLLDLLAPDFVVDFSRRLVDPFVARDLDPVALTAFFNEARETWGDLPAWEPRS